MMGSMKDRGVPQQRVGAIYLVLTLAGCGGALALAYGYRLGTVTAASAMLPSLATVYLAWASFRADRSEAVGGHDLEQIADDLADAVAAQWRVEARVRQVQEPYPLPLAWNGAPPTLVEDWATLTAMATFWPTRRRNERDSWARGPGELAGRWEQAHEMLTRRVPTGRLLVLGEPGSGKSVLLTHLLQQIAHDRDSAQGRLVPVLFALSSWNPRDQELTDWMARCLERDYPALRHPAAIHATATRAQILLERGQILPLLDGFDELPTEHHPAALNAINRFLSPGQGIVLSSRAHDYQAALGRGAAKLTGAAGIELQPVPPGPAAIYLTHTAADPRHWDPLIAQLGSDTPVGRALRTPQMLFLTRMLYNAQPGSHEHIATPEPAELLNGERFPDTRTIEQHLLRNFIPAAYRRAAADAKLPFSAQLAEHTLTFLADHLRRTTPASRDIAWWQLPEALPCRPTVLARWAATATSTALRVTTPAGLTAALVYSLLRAAQTNAWTQTPRALTAGVLGAITAALVCAATATVKLAVRKTPDGRGWTAALTPLSSVRWHWDTSAIALALTSATVLATATALLTTGTLGATLAAPLGVTAVIWGGTRAGSADPATASTPDALLENERSTVLRNGLILATAGATATAALYAWRVRTDATYPTALLTGAAAGIVVGVFAGLLGRLHELASWSFTTTCHHLAANHGLPRDLMAFLSDAHQHRGILRQVGGVYQFRHPDLQRALTTKSPHHPAALGDPSDAGG